MSSIKRYSYWWSQTPPDFSFQSQLPTHADMIILGADFVGIATALWIAKNIRINKKPFRVLVLDDAPYAGFHTTGRMMGDISIANPGSVSEVIEKIGEDSAKKLYYYSRNNNKLLKSLVTRTTSPYDFNGGARIATTAKEVAELETTHSIFKDWNLPCTLLDQEQTQQIVLNPRAKGGLYVASEGMIDPFQFTTDMTRSLRRNGIWVSYATKVASVGQDPSKDMPFVVLDNGHVITSPRIVHTSPDTVPVDKSTESLLSNVVPYREAALATQEFSEELEEMPLPGMPIYLNGGNDTLRIIDRNVLMTGGKANLRKKDPDQNVKINTANNRKILENLTNCLTKNFPLSHHVDISHTWSFIDWRSKDFMPFVGELNQYNGQYVNFGYGKNELSLAFLASKNLVETIMSIRVQDSSLQLFDPLRFF